MSPATEPKWGSNYYNGLKLIYNNGDNVYALLEADAESKLLPIEPALLEAMLFYIKKHILSHCCVCCCWLWWFPFFAPLQATVACCGGYPCYDKLMMWVSTHDTTNDKEARGICRIFCRLRLSCRDKQLPAARKIIEWMARRSPTQKHTHTHTHTHT